MFFLPSLLLLLLLHPRLLLVSRFGPVGRLGYRIVLGGGPCLHVHLKDSAKTDFNGSQRYLLRFNQVLFDSMRPHELFPSFTVSYCVLLGLPGFLDVAGFALDFSLLPRARVCVLPLGIEGRSGSLRDGAVFCRWKTPVVKS